MARKRGYGKPRRASSGVSSPLTGRGRADAPTWYEIPYRAIVPKGSENVLAPAAASTATATPTAPAA